MACVASMLVWAVGFPVADELLKVLPPIAIATLRLSMAALALLPFWYLSDAGREWRSAAWARALVIGATGSGVSALLLIYAQGRTDGITIAVIFAAMPIAGIALECLFDGRRLTWRLIAGIILSTIGGVAVYGARMGHLNMGLGALSALVSVVIFAWGARASVKALPDLSALGRTTITLTGGAIVAVVVQAFLDLTGSAAVPWHLIGAREWLYLAIYSVGSLAIAQLLFLKGVATLGVAVATMHHNVAPFYVMVFSLAFGAGWNWGQVAAAALVVFGVIVAQGRERRRTA
ncbi:DMT family transporter [Defluviimonas salinarum]|uniref:DMT family transporter n=1 Tax=Defluviimonas salinarum TaxID=2992147 RepID=A0ABT3IZJ5_9RHOB|nr:DMT family transporter [Defluviimonas salinarum]MCW3780853.1 DMT family transporter [Defluviimonas salinarum]